MPSKLSDAWQPAWLTFILFDCRSFPRNDDTRAYYSYSSRLLCLTLSITRLATTPLHHPSPPRDWLLTQVTFETPVGDRGALVVDDAYLWTTNADASTSIVDGDNEVLESTGALVCSECQVRAGIFSCPAW